MKYKNSITNVLFLLPAIILFSFFVLTPMVGTVLYSFTSMNFTNLKMNFNGFENYIRLFTSKEVVLTIKNTFIFTFVVTLIINVVGLSLAVALERKLKTVNLLRMIFFAPAMLSPLVIGYVWSFLMNSNEYGLFNKIIELFGIANVNWLGNPNIALFSITIIYAWQWSGWVMVIYLANLKIIPTELYEAAEVDGAKNFIKFWRITFPLLLPSFRVNVIITMIGALRVYDIIVSTTKGGPGYATQTLGFIIIEKSFSDGMYGYGSAIATILFVSVLIITMLQLVFYRKWENKIS